MTKWSLKHYIIAGILAVALIVAILSSFVGGATKPTDQTSAIASEVAQQSSGGVIFAFILLVGVILAIISHVIYEAYDATAKKLRWRKAFEHSVFIAIGVLLIVNTAIYLAAYPAWVWLRKDLIFYWSLNLLVILLIFLKTKTMADPAGGAKAVEDKTARKAGTAVLVLIAVMFIFRVFGGSIKSTQARKEVTDNNRVVVVEILKDPDSPLLPIAQCISGMRQYEPGQEKEYLVQRDYKGAIGIMGIPERYAADAKNNLGLDIYKLEDNVKFAQQSWKKNGALIWMDYVECWVKDVRRFPLIIYAPPAPFWTPIIWFPSSQYPRFRPRVHEDRLINIVYGYDKSKLWEVSDSPYDSVVADMPPGLGTLPLRNMKFQSGTSETARVEIDVEYK